MRDSPVFHFPKLKKKKKKSLFIVESNGFPTLCKI